jgi:hypothetical protein
MACHQLSLWSCGRGWQKWCPRETGREPHLHAGAPLHAVCTIEYVDHSCQPQTQAVTNILMFIQKMLARLTGDCMCCLADECHCCSCRDLCQTTPTKLVLVEEHDYEEALQWMVGRWAAIKQLLLAGLQKLLKCVNEKDVWKPSDKPGIRNQLRSPEKFSLEVVRELIAELIGEVKGNLDDRFPNLDILSAFHIFDPRSYGDVKQSQLSAFGSANYKKLLKHFDGKEQAHRLFNADRAELVAALAEFERVKPRLWNAGLEGTSMLAFWRHLSETDVLSLSHVLKLVQICFVVPLNSACAERGFSLHNLIKTKLRNRMRIPALDALMRTQSQDVDFRKFNYEAAVSMYHEKGTLFKMPRVFAAVKNECGGADTDSGDSEDLDGSDALEYESEGSMLMTSDVEEDEVSSDVEQAEESSEVVLGEGPSVPEDEAFLREWAE